MRATFSPFLADRIPRKFSDPKLPFLKVGLIGAGDVVKNRTAPALDAMKADGIRRPEIAICSLEATSPIENHPHRYYQGLPNNLLPLNDLDADGFLNSQALWIVATPPQIHVPLALQLIGRCGRVAIEKPLAADPRHARVLLPFVNNQHSVCPLDHKLFTAASLRFLDDCRENSSLPDEIHHAEGVFLESAGFPHGRAQEDGISDVQWHMLMIIIAAFKNLGRHFEIGIESARITRHTSDASGTFGEATVCTASYVTGNVDAGDLDVRFRLLQAKGAPHNQKHIRFFDSQNNLLAHVDLGESGWYAHGRMLDALMRPAADMRHTLADAIALTDLVAATSTVTEEQPPYAFGTLPDFIERQCDWSVHSSGTGPDVGVLSACDSIPKSSIWRTPRL